MVHAAFLVIGRTYAGKTTFGEYVRGKYGLRFVEASSVVRMLKSESEEEGADPFDSTKRLLESEGRDVVGRKIVELLLESLGRDFVVTGLRTIEAFDLVKEAFPHVVTILVEASEETRFRRHLESGRFRSLRTVEEFREFDSRQSEFGLLRVAEDLADVRMVNEDTLEQYEQQIDALLSAAGMPELG